MNAEAELKITVLCENSAGPCGLGGAHGLALLVEVDGRRFLFDTGPDETAVRNAARLGVSLRGLQALVLSHGHYDHTGGLAAVLERTGPLRVVAHPQALGATYRRSGDDLLYLGMPLSEADFAARGARFELSSEPVQLSPCLRTTGQVPTQHRPPAPGAFVRKHPVGLLPDDYPDDLSLIAEMPPGLVLITGCAHAGLVNIARQARELCGGAPLWALLGGTHLHPLPAEEVAGLGRELAQEGLRLMCAGHCTGEAAVQVLESEFPGEVRRIPTGTVAEFLADGTYRLAPAASGVREEDQSIS